MSRHNPRPMYYSHIFIDPNPDPARSFVERKRLFDMPRSSWTDYSAEVLSDTVALPLEQVPLLEPGLARCLLQRVGGWGIGGEELPPRADDLRLEARVGLGGFHRRTESSVQG